MNYKYDEAKKRESYPEVYIRLKYERKYYRCEYYDGIRILYDTVPQGKYHYETRHSDNDVSLPVSIKPEGEPVIVNFCGTIVSDIPIQISGEKHLMDIRFWGGCVDEYANTRCYNPI